MALKKFEINENLQVGKTIIFKSEIPQLVFLEMWNISKKTKLIKINGLDLDFPNGESTEDAHHFRKFTMSKDDTIDVFCEDSDGLFYNLIY